MQIPLQSNYREILQPISGNASPHIRNSLKPLQVNYHLLANYPQKLNQFPVQAKGFADRSVRYLYYTFRYIFTVCTMALTKAIENRYWKNHVATDFFGQFCRIVKKGLGFSFFCNPGFVMVGKSEVICAQGSFVFMVTPLYAIRKTD